MKRGWIVLTICWMFFIFYQGIQSNEASHEVSDRIVNPLITLINQVEEWMDSRKESIDEVKEEVATEQQDEEVKDSRYEVISYRIRKIAHFFEYFMLAVLLSCIFKSHSVSNGSRVIYSLFLVLLCAVSDEFIQSFVTRNSSVRDVVLDFTGGMMGALLFHLDYHVRLKRYKR